MSQAIASRYDDVAAVIESPEINDGEGLIKLDAPCCADPSGRVRISVEVDWATVVTKAVARLYLIADGNRDPLIRRVSLIPDLVPPHVTVQVPLDRSGYVRALVEWGDGALLEVRRWVWVIPSEV